MTNSNAEELFSKLEDYYEEIIDQMNDEFNSHDFIEKLSQAHQDLYVQLLNQYAENGQPFQTVHGILAKRLKNNWKHLVRYVDTDKSENIFGNYNDAAIWQKVK